MGIVNLVSGGMDSSLISMLIIEQKIPLFPLFVDYGQRCVEMEWKACCDVHKKLGNIAPIRMDLSGFGKIIHSGLTSSILDVKMDAFTPCRNLFFLVSAAAYAYQLKVDTVSIGFLNEKFSLFPDQNEDFIINAEQSIYKALGEKIKIITPLSKFSKIDVINLAKQKGLIGTYSCHQGTEIPCGVCISCLEIQQTI